MKRLYIFLLVLVLTLALILSGCKKKEDLNTPMVKPPVENPKDDVVVEDEEDEDTLIKDFTDILSKEEPEKTVAFIDSNLDKLSELDGDIMIDGLERQLEDGLNSTSNRIWELDEDDELLEIGEYNFEFSENKISEIKNADLKEEVEKTYNNNYKLVNIEGEFYPIIDYAKLQKYNEYLTAEWIDYLNIMAMDSNNVVASDGGLVISYDDLAKRLLVAENYLNSYIDGQRQEKMLGIYENKIWIYLKGLPNTPIYDWDTKIIEPEVLASYEKTANVENYLTANIVFRYLEMIKNSNNIIDDNILNEADKLIKEVMEMLTEFK